MSTEELPLPLESYAAVIAGLGAGLPLSRALQVAEVRAADWDVGSARWLEAIDESAVTDLSVLVAFDGALLAAKRRFEPVVEPIESDPRAWASFRRHFVTAVSPPDFLAERGVSLATYARLEASWVEKLAADPALSKVFAGYMEEPMTACPTLILSPSVHLAAGAPAPNVPVAAPSVQAAPSPSMPVMPAPSVAVAAPSMPVMPAPSMPVMPAPNVPVVAFSVPVAAPSVTPAPVAAVRPGLDVTGEIPRDIIARSASAPLPFERARAAPVAPAAPPAPTSPAYAAPAPPAKAGVAAAPQAPVATPPKPAHPGMETSGLPAEISEMIARGALPFARSVAQTPAPAPAPIARPPAAPVPTPPKAPPPAPAPTPHAPSYLKQPVPAATPGVSPDGPPAPPAAGKDISLDQYAAMCAELAVFPHQSERIFAKYGLSDVRQRSAVDTAWKERLKRHPAEREEWERRYWQHEGLMRRHRT